MIDNGCNSALHFDVPIRFDVSDSLSFNNKVETDGRLRVNKFSLSAREQRNSISEKIENEAVSRTRVRFSYNNFSLFFFNVVITSSRVYCRNCQAEIWSLRCYL